MRIPSFGSRPVNTSQYSRWVLTPVPSGDGHVSSAGATVGFRAAGAGLRVGAGRFVWASTALADKNTVMTTAGHRPWILDRRPTIALIIETHGHRLRRRAE